MRQFTPKEKEMIEKIIHHKESGELLELQFGELIKGSLDKIAIAWSVGSEPNISVYSIGDGSDGENRSFFEISDFLYFIDELANNSLIKIDSHHIDWSKDLRIICDKTKYNVTQNENGDYIFTTKIIKNGAIIHKNIIYISQQYNFHIANLFEKYATAIIYPLPILIDLANNEFKDIEQRNFERQLQQERQHHKQAMLDATNKHKKQMCWTRWSFLVALFAVIIPSAISIYIFNNTPATKVDSDQLGTIEKAIKSTKSEFPNQIDVSLPDTITVKDIDQKPIINNIYNNIPQNNAQK